MRYIEGMVVAALIAAAAPGSVSAATKSINCNVAGTKISTAVLDMKPGDTLLVKGTCKENVYIGFGITEILIDGQGLATIKPPLATQPAVFVRGRGVSVANFRITGGSDGVMAEAGAFVQVYGNTISNAARWGIVLDSGMGRIYGNVIESNGAGGIILNRNADAMIGVPYWGVATASPNTIRNNNGQGIWVLASSSATIIGNTIANNALDGIAVWRASNAETASNQIDANGGSGVTIGDNAAVNIGLPTGTTIFDLPNSTTTLNAGYGMQCWNGAMILGRRGTLSGTAGPMQIDPSCVGAITPP